MVELLNSQEGYLFMDYIKDKRILITGVCGTVGSDLLRLLLEESIYKPEEVIGLDNNESDLFFVDQKYLNDTRASFFVADVRDYSKLQQLMKNIDVVFHVAALKHVVLCERSPFEAVQTNIHGVQNIICSALENNVDRVVFTSSDKAVNPTNVMGTSKLMGERLMTAANSTRRGERTIFTSTRFGNVLGSNGSVIPIFHKQIAKGGPVTLTNSEMTRFVMSTDEASRLVIESASLARGGEVFITKMPVVRIKDLADVMIQELAPGYGYTPNDIEVIEIGAKPGEKLYEELMSDEETRRAVELQSYFSVLPAFRGMYNAIDYDYPDVVGMKVDDAYASSNEMPLIRDELRSFLTEHGLLTGFGVEPDHPDRRYWPGDKEQVNK